MKCPESKSDHINKNGHRGQKQNYIGSAEKVIEKHRSLNQ
jgi:hypothetical protein